VHSHAEAPRDFSAAFAIGISLNLIFVVVEVVYGLISHSMALVADAGHNLGDVLGLGLSWGALLLAQRRPTMRRTYGLRATTILASLTNGVVLLVVTGGVLWESIRRMMAPEPVGGLTVIVVALVGVAINGLSALLFMAGRKGDLNIRSAFLHLASDAALALGVAIAGGVMLFTGWNWLDPVVSILLSLAILAGTWSLLRQSVDLLLGSVPEGIDPEAVRAYLLGLPGVEGIHDLHIWAVSTTETALTAHLIARGGALPPGSLDHTCEELNQRFRIARSTIQVESPAAHPCRLAAEEPAR
jgi:cobalt-zinc-cadmium efflux system protein